jgi:hypothetical protein
MVGVPSPGEDVNPRWLDRQINAPVNRVRARKQELERYHTSRGKKTLPQEALDHLATKAQEEGLDVETFEKIMKEPKKP